MSHSTNSGTHVTAGDPDEHIVTVDSVDAGYGDMQVLSGVSICADQGEIITLAGPNGAGKSTLQKAIAGLVIPTAGSVVFKGDNVTTESANERLRRGIAFIPQGRSVFASMTVHENLQMGGYVFDGEETSRRVKEVYEMFPELRDRSGAKASALSGGQQQMVELGRGLVSDPDVLLVDEPSLGLAPKILSDIFGTLQRLAEEGFVVIMVEQNVHKALEISDRAYVLADGQIQFEGAADEVADDEKMGRLYLGGGP